MHSELRPHIGQLSFQMILPFHDGDANERFQIKVSDSRKKLTVTDKVSKTSEDIELPARISEGAVEYIVSQPSVPPQGLSHDKKKMVFSYRLQVDQEDVQTLRRNSLDDDYIPWDADSMKDRGDLLCRYCDYPVAHCGYGWRWRNLPSSNWADMMDLWHCHKPHSKEDQQQTAAEESNASRRGIGPSNRVVARRQAVYVDTSTLLLSKEDCWTIKLEVRINAMPISHRPIQSKLVQVSYNADSHHHWASRRRLSRLSPRYCLRYRCPKSISGDGSFISNGCSFFLDVMIEVQIQTLREKADILSV